MAHGAMELGSVLAGRYRVERVIGQGGMGVVVQATHLQLQQPVALKFLLPEVLGSQQIVERFVREAQAVVRLRSEHVARVLDVGMLDAATPYMVFEFLEGADLARVPRPQLSPGAIVDLVLQACEALAEAHALGIVHRDIKPANLFVTRRADGSLLLKVLDFGISKISAPGTRLTATQAVLGTAAYMSPEQMRSSRDVDHRSDIWSLGIVMYELLQGAPPFDGGSYSATVLRVAHDPTPPLTVRLPGDLDRVIYRCLEKDPARRFQTTAELARALAGHARSEAQAAISVARTSGIAGGSPPPPALPVAPPGASAALPSTISGSVASTTTPARAGRRWSAVGFACALVIGGAAISVVSRRGGDAGSRVAPAPAAAVGGSAAAVDAGVIDDGREAIGAGGRAPHGIDGGVSDAPHMARADDAGAGPRPQRPGSASTTGQRPHTTGDHHGSGSPARSTPPANQDPPRPARPVFDRGD